MVGDHYLGVSYAIETGQYFCEVFQFPFEVSLGLRPDQVESRWSDIDIVSQRDKIQSALSKCRYEMDGSIAATAFLEYEEWMKQNPAAYEYEFRCSFLRVLLGYIGRTPAVINAVQSRDDTAVVSLIPGAIINEIEAVYRISLENFLSMYKNVVGLDVILPVDQLRKELLSYWNPPPKVC